MIFKDILDKKHKSLESETQHLVELAYKNQSHSGDLLLVLTNGFYSEALAAANEIEGKNFNPYAVGPGKIGLSEKLHHNFINDYVRNNTASIPYESYLAKLEEDAPSKKHNNEWTRNEEKTIQFEMLIYLKFWEADMIIKRFYQLVRLIKEQPYDWNFRLKYSSGKEEDHTGDRYEVILFKVRNQLKTHSNLFYEIMDQAYFTQLRNAIAHSQYGFLGRYIHLNNFKENNKKITPYPAITFDQWVEFFHNTLALHQQYLRMKQLIHDYYLEIANRNANSIEVVTPDINGDKRSMYLTYSDKLKEWKPLQRH